MDFHIHKMVKEYKTIEKSQNFRDFLIQMPLDLEVKNTLIVLLNQRNLTEMNDLLEQKVRILLEGPTS